MGPILTYHYLGTAPPDAGRHRGLYVPEQEFRGHLGAIKSMELHTVSPEEYHAGLISGGGARSVWITFDDGKLDNYETAFPLLREAGMTATFFVIVERVLGGEPGYMTPAMLKEMLAAGMSVGSHTLTHPRLARLPAEEMAREVHASKRRLEDALGAPVTSFCYPYGNLDDRVVAEVKDSGYLLATSTIRGNRNSESDRFTLKRAMIMPGRTGARFRYTFTPLYHWLHVWKNRRRWKPGGTAV